MIIWAIKPPVHDSAVARVAPVRTSSAKRASGRSVEPSPRTSVAEPLVNQPGRGFDQFLGLFLGRGGSTDAEADGRVMSGDTDLWLAAAGRQVQRLRFDVGLSLAEEVDLAMNDDSAR